MGDNLDHGQSLEPSTATLSVISSINPTTHAAKIPPKTSMTVAERMKKFEEANGKPIAPKPVPTHSLGSASGIPLPRNRSLEPKADSRNVTLPTPPLRKTSAEPLQKQISAGDVAQPERNGIMVTHGIHEIRSKLPIVSRPPITTLPSTTKPPRVLAPHVARPTASSRSRAAENGVDDKTAVAKRPTMEPRKSSAKSGTVDFHPLQARIRTGTHDRIQKAAREKTIAYSSEASSPTDSLPDETVGNLLSKSPRTSGANEVKSGEESNMLEEDKLRIQDNDNAVGATTLQAPTDQNIQLNVFPAGTSAINLDAVNDTHHQTNGSNPLAVDDAAAISHAEAQIHQEEIISDVPKNLSIDTKSPSLRKNFLSIPSKEEESPVQGRFDIADPTLPAITNTTDFDLDPQHDWIMTDFSGVSHNSSGATNVTHTSYLSTPSPSKSEDAESDEMGLDGFNTDATIKTHTAPPVHHEVHASKPDLYFSPQFQDLVDTDHEDEAMGFRTTGLDLASLHIPPHFDGSQDFSEASATMFKRNSMMSNTSAQLNSSLREQPSSYLDPSLQTHRSSYRSSWTGNSSHSTEHSTEPDGADSMNDIPDGSSVAPLNLQRQSPKPAVPPKPYGYSPLLPQNSQQRQPSISADTTQRFIGRDETERRGNHAQATYQYRENGTPTATEGSAYVPPTPPSSNSYKSSQESSQVPRLSSPLLDVRNHNAHAESYIGVDSITDDSRPISISEKQQSHSEVSTHRSSRERLTSSAQEAVLDSLPEPPEEERARWFQRYSVIKELVDTEGLYLKDMHVFHEIYKGTSEACSTLTAEDIKLLFRNIDQIVRFTTLYVEELKAAAAPIYIIQRTRSKSASQVEQLPLTKASLSRDHESKDRATRIAKAILRNLDRMQHVYRDFLKQQAEASERLKELQSNPIVALWLEECNKVAKELTAAWDIDSLWSKPLQRITKLPLTLRELQKQTPDDHPDYRYLQALIPQLMTVVQTVNASAGESQINRKRAVSTPHPKSRNALWKKLSEPRSAKDTKALVDVEFNKVCSANHNDFMRIQIIVRDVEEYCRATTDFCAVFERCVTCIEGVVLYVGKTVSTDFDWKEFSKSVAAFQSQNLPAHIGHIQKHVLNPLDEVLKVFATIQSKILKRATLLPGHDKHASYQKSGKKIDDKLAKSEIEYQQLNSSLKSELPVFAACLHRIVNRVQARFVSDQAEFIMQWQEGIERFFGGSATYHLETTPEDFGAICDMWNHRFEEVDRNLPKLKILDRAGGIKRASMGKSASTSSIMRQSMSTTNVRASGPLSPRSRGHSTITVEGGARPRGQSFNGAEEQNELLQRNVHERGDWTHRAPESADLKLVRTRQRLSERDLGEPMYERQAKPIRPASSTSASGSANSSLWLHGSQRPQTGRSSSSNPRLAASHHESIGHDDFSARISESFGLFSSAMPLEDTLREPSRKLSSTNTYHSQTSTFLAEQEAQRRPRLPTKTLYMAASLFEFNIEGVKTEAGYPYLTYPAGDIFDVIAEKGELWLAKNNEDPTNRIGWIWSKHFARFASLDDNEPIRDELE